MISVVNVQVLELEKCGVQLEQCQLVRYNEKSGTMGRLFDEPKVRGRVMCVSVCMHACVCLYVYVFVCVSACMCVGVRVRVCVTCRIINSCFPPRNV